VAAGSYDDITVAQSSTTTFTGGTYYIDKLVVGKSATVNLAAGRYFIDKLSLDDNARIVVSSGPVQLYIGSEVVGDDDLSFNAAGAVADFQVFLYPGADWEVDKDVTFVGVIYAPGSSSDIEFDDDSSIRGALVTAGEVKLGKDTSLTFSAADQAAVGGVSTCAATAAVPSGFNAFETATAGGSVSGVIRTKVAASAFNLDVVALKTGGTAIETAFAGGVKLELVDASSATSCSSYLPIQALNTLTFTATDQGRKTLTGISEADAWANVRVRMTYPATGTPTITACSTDNFAIRPASFGSVTVSDADSVTAGTTRTLYNTAASGGNVHKAGRPFSVAAAVLPATATNYAGMPSGVLSACIGSGCSTSLGVFSLGSGAVDGVINSTTASYSEVGAFTLQLQDQTFASVDADDTTADCSATGRYVCSPEVAVGRFVPDHFDLTPASTPQFKTFNDTACAARSFTYVGQPFGYLTLPQATITAKNAAGVTTANYAGALWKLAASGATQTYSAATGTLDTGLVGTPAVVETGSGSGTLTADAADVIAFVRGMPVVPFAADINLSMSIQDTAENAVTGNGAIDTATPALFADMAFDSGDEIRFGRLLLANAHGSELLALPVLIEAQYWNGSGFTRNAADACTQLAANQVALTNWRRSLDVCETSVALSGRFVAGRGNLRFSAPGTDNTGSVDLTLQLGAVGTGSGCVAEVATPAVGASQSWLQGAWTGGAYNQNPAARASFGLYRSSKSLIYMREMY
jgi:MSHA biogenesis protein MshQ